ncbi:MAG: undecaprenyl-diphosphate phosphatase [Lachnospiraceae bacterium]|nr:undecaprenyl-diphosphate phosphatase [Lachnospiraceae bacterium]
MDLFTAVLLGIIQGIAEFLPVSSSGHLVIFEKIAGFGIPALPFLACVHAGTAIAVISVLHRDVIRIVVETWRMIKDIFHNMVEYLGSVRRGTDADYVKIVRTNYRKLIVLITVSTIPTALMGILMERAVRMAAESLLFTGIGLLLTGVILLVTSVITPGDELPRDIPAWKMFLIGVAQGLALFPGVSRLAVTLSGGIFAGMSEKTATRISYLMFIPVSLGALAAELTVQGTAGFDLTGMLPAYAAGTAAAALTGIIMGKHVLRFLRARKLTGFAYYCFIAGSAAVVLNYFI